MITTLVPLALGALALVLGAVEDLGLLDQGVNIFGAALVAVALLKEGLSLRRDLRPVRARRALSVSVLASSERVVAAAELVQRLRDLGFRQTTLACKSDECHGQATILFHPSADIAEDTVVRLQELCPETHLLVFSHSMIRGLRLSETLTACMSMIRLIGDLGAIAELRQQ